MLPWLFVLLLSSVIALPVTSIAEPLPQFAPATNAERPELIVLLDVRATTWRPRGRISFSVAPAIKMKLLDSGFHVTEVPEEPHDLILVVEYREERGRPISIQLSGTEINCVIALVHPRQGTVLLAQIHEAPTYTELISAPYVEVVEKLQANPYFYFLGDLIRGWTDEDLDLTGALIQAVDRQYELERHPPPTTPLDTLLSPSETFPDLNQHYAAWAQANAVEELGRLKDARAVPVIEKLLSHTESQTRLRAVLALAQFDAPSIPASMERVALKDADAGVRLAATRVLAGLSTR